MTETQSLTVIDPPQQLARRASDVAGVCREIVLKTAVSIQGKKHVKVEGWQAIATAHGCIAGSRDVQRVDGGWTAIGEVRRMSDGVLLATAEGYVGKDEKRWKSAEEYACRSMAQTRAISRVCRAAFAHVVVLMDAGLETTPAEEMPPPEGFNAPDPIKTAKPAKNPATAKQTPKKATPDAFKKRFLERLAPIREHAWYFAVEAGWILDNEPLDAISDTHIPKTKEEFDNIVGSIQDRMDAGDLAPNLLKAKYAVVYGDAPGTEPPDDPGVEDESWRVFPMPFGKHAGVSLEDLEKNYLYGLWANFEVEQEYNGKPKKPETIARDTEFRRMLDLAGEHYEFKD